MSHVGRRRPLPPDRGRDHLPGTGRRRPGTGGGPGGGRRRATSLGRRGGDHRGLPAAGHDQGRRRRARPVARPESQAGEQGNGPRPGGRLLRRRRHARRRGDGEERTRPLGLGLPEPHPPPEPDHTPQAPQPGHSAQDGPADGDHALPPGEEVRAGQGRRQGPPASRTRTASCGTSTPTGSRSRTSRLASPEVAG